MWLALRPSCASADPSSEGSVVLTVVLPNSVESNSDGGHLESNSEGLEGSSINRPGARFRWAGPLVKRLAIRFKALGVEFPKTYPSSE